MRCLFCFGFGYCAQRLAQSLPNNEWQVIGTKRKESNETILINFDGSKSIADPDLFKGTTHLLISIPPGVHGDPVLKVYGSELAALKRLEWIGYLSSTSVYGDSGGHWIAEDFPPNPSTERGLNRLLAEDQWFAFGENTGVSVQVFRLAGIYGPGRSVFDRLRCGTAKRIDLPDAITNRIFIDDIVQVLYASIQNPGRGSLYNAADDEPANPAEVIEYACRLIGLSPPPLVSLENAGLSELGRSFYLESRRVSNKRIKNELKIILQYPTYREGLGKIFNSEQ